MSAARKIRIGIDVGGTFTHAVALDGATLALLGKAKVPTTHAAGEGVARGVVESLLQLLHAAQIAPGEVVLIAHSTTQATNALLEGDVAPVGIVAMGSGLGAWLAARQAAIRPIPLAPGRQLATTCRFIRAEDVREETVTAALEALVRAGAEVIVAAEAFSVDDPRHEQYVCEMAAAHGLPATATHHVSRLHGLGIRTRTAVINASMLPRMLHTANMTEQAVREAGIRAPVMIMRSDGGLMDIAEMRRRPVLTMLSGPAAGVAAALLYARVSDGVFLEVGGTSTDISAIKHGRCQIRTAEVGGQKLHVRTLDVRTLGVAGGSLVTLRDGKVAEVGPRSSHIAGLPYLSFADTASVAPGQADGEHARYLHVQAGDQPLALTPTCASNLLGLVPAGDPAQGNAATIAAGFACAARAAGTAAEPLADAILARGAQQVGAVVEGLIRDYRLERGVIRLVGGGGGAAAIVPYVAKTMKLPFDMVKNADVISAIGVALALVRDMIERTVISPTEEDIRRIREEAFTSVLQMGAAAETIEVFVEVDARRNLLRATAEGATEIRQRELRARELNADERAALVAASMGITSAPPRCPVTAAGFEVWVAERTVPRLWRFLPERRQLVRVLDRAGAVRWASNDADLRASTAGAAEQDLERFAELYTRYSDAGATIPRCHVLIEGRVLDLSGLAEMKQVLELLRIELKRFPNATPCVLLVALRA